MRSLFAMLAIAVLVGFAAAPAANAEPFVPGTGVKVSAVGDNFEDPKWGYIFNSDKASHEQDGEQRPPGGRSKNGRWYEGAKRGQPDYVRRIATPPGGLPGSRGSLMLATKYSGIPGQISGKQMQDDFLMGVETRLGKPIPATWHPSVVVRVFLPEFDRWEQRSGASFGVRIDATGRTADGSVEPYWPGMFILFRHAGKKYDHDHAQITIRARENGSDVPGPIIEEPGWWTFGISCTPDGQIHQYASPGVDDLTAEDHLYSSTPYNTKFLGFNNFFVNVANLDNGQNWSTPWTIDDPTVYVIPPRGQSVANLVKSGSAAARTAQAAAGRRTQRR